LVPTSFVYGLRIGISNSWASQRNTIMFNADGFLRSRSGYVRDYEFCDPVLYFLRK
jgi:hypothetical protein